MVAIKLLIWLIAPLVNAWVDRKGKKPFYLVVNIVRGMAAILHGILFIPSTVWENYWPYWWPVLIFEITSFWLVFEVALYFFWNHYHPTDPKPLFYYDTKEGDSGLTDKFFRWTGPVGHKVAKGMALALLIFSIVIIYQRQ